MDRTTNFQHRKRIYRTALAWSWIALLVCLVQPAEAESAPGKGRFLVASADLLDANFYHTVILLISYGEEEGAMGLVINRPTTILPRRILPGVAGLTRYNGPMFFGGPVMLDQIVFLWRGAGPAGEGEPVFGGVRFSASRTLLDSLASEPTDASRLRIYAGYAGWAPGQLDFELRQGGWHVVAASEAAVFADDPGSVWKNLLPMAEPITAALTP
jgi:putative transcriptional regulator